METRIKASQLLFVLLTHLEETSVAAQPAEPLLNLLHPGTKDSERAVVENVRMPFCQAWAGWAGGSVVAAVSKVLQYKDKLSYYMLLRKSLSPSENRSTENLS